MPESASLSSTEQAMAAAADCSASAVSWAAVFAGAFVTGLAPADAERQVTDIYGQAKTKATEAADAARKSGAYPAFYLFLSRLIGAFIACVAAAFGGSQRDAFHAGWKRG